MKRITLGLLAAVAAGAPFLAGPALAATEAQIDLAIQKGLAWLVTIQHPTGGYFGSNYLLANTATAVLAFENEGHFPGGGNTYSANVEKGLDWIFSRAYKIGLSPQWAGNPDSNGNGLGVYFSYQSYVYETGLVMQAIVASNTPDRIVTTGACAGMTYRAVMEDVVEFVAWAQIDGGPGRGGWRYGYYNNVSAYGDNSVAQWPVLGLVAAEQWGIQAPQFVKDEMGYWAAYIQNPLNGASGYDTPTTYNNISKTGGLLVEFYYLGDEQNTPRSLSARGYVNAHWNEGPSGTWYGNKGHPYAMFSVFKGLELMKVAEVPNAPANPDTPAGDWWGDYCHYLVNTQAAAGYWNGYTSYWGAHLATPWYIIILQSSVFPVSVNVEVPGAACDQDGHEVLVNYSVERFTANGTLSLYRDGSLFDSMILTEFIGSDTWNVFSVPETVGDHIWRAVLDVTGGGITTQAEDTDSAKVYPTPQVADIPDQVAPFTTFDLDDFQTCVCNNATWSASGVPVGWSVYIDPDNVVTVTAPPDATEPADITFSGKFDWQTIVCEDSDAATFSPNRPPVALPDKPYPDETYYVDEGGSIVVNGYDSYDPDGHAIVSYEWDFDGDGTFEVSGVEATFSAANLDGPMHTYIHLRVTDEFGAWSIGTGRVEVLNVAPSIDAFSAPTTPVPVGTAITLLTHFSDPCPVDTHVLAVNWDDGTSDDPSPATSPAMRTHTYTLAGIYRIAVTVTDDDGGADQEFYEYLVVYDPNGGFVTGGGWINSPAGAYKPDPSLAGKANFGFVAKYKKGQSEPVGTTEFQFHAGDMNFHSEDYLWLVITGSNYARFKGRGSVNGAGDCLFMLWAGDAAPDTFRIRVWKEDALGNELVIYDNGMDQAIAGGSIVIHR